VKRRVRDSHVRRHMHHILALKRVGWRVVEIRPEPIASDVALWHTTITRLDGDASITVTSVDLDDGIEELVRYAEVDAA
jgi:hypothetical protein